VQDYVINKIEFAYDDLDEAFPAVDPGVEPFGSRVLVQIRLAKKKTKGGIILTGDTKDTELWNTQVAKVVAVGSLAFKNRNTQEPWPEGSWCSAGDFVRVPKYGGDKWTVRMDEDREVIFVIFNDLDLIGRVTGDPLAMKAFV
jgi:co-chaperonin GroES (HSP10)